MMQSRLTIGRLASRYIIARDHPDPAALAGRLDGAARALPRYLAAVLAPLAAETSDAIWLLRSIEIELALNAGADPEAAAATWSQTLGRAVLARLDGGADGLLFFPDRASYLASFLRDLAEGEAGGLWYYESFAGLRMLPVAAALRTALIADPPLGRRALLSLPSWQAVRVLTALGRREAEAVLQGLDPPAAEAAPAPAALAVAILAAWREAATFGLDPGPLALGCWLAMVREAPAVVGHGAAVFARALAALRLAVVEGLPAAVAHWFAAADLPALYRALGPEKAEPLAPLLDLPIAARSRLAVPAEHEALLVGDAPRDTMFGGLFLLLPHLAAVPPAAPGAAPTEKLQRFLVLAACAGDDMATAVVLDPVWRDLFGLPADLPLADCKAWIAGLPEGATDAVLGGFARTLPGFAVSSPDYLRRNFLDCRARVTGTAELIEVELGRPPLDLVLGIAGLNRERLSLPWLDARPIQLHPRQGAAEP
jgi:hypothetical protein